MNDATHIEDLAGRISAFVNAHPTVKMLALSFLVLIGATLIADGFDYHVAKPLIYGPIAFAIGVETLNLMSAKRQRERGRRSGTPVHLRERYVDQSSV